jgi:hypothetical protein
MPHLAAQGVDYSPAIGLCWSFGQDDEAVTSQVYPKDPRAAREEIFGTSAFWPSKARFEEARLRLNATVSLQQGWDTYGAESPNHVARSLASRILNALEASVLPPTHLMPSVEGGIAMSFVEGDNRAEIEIYNTGEVAVATYSGQGEPAVWELDCTDSALQNAIDKIRVHLAA